MEDAVQFFAGTKEFTIGPENFFVVGRPCGISKEVWDPMDLPTFHLEPPKEDMIRALRVWKEKGLLTTDTKVIEDLEDNGVMKDVHDDRGRVTQKTKMLYRRRFLERWLKPTFHQSF